MRNLVYALALVLLTSAVPALAQPAGECPEDVGAALAAACPCDADGSGREWRNHGKYVSCVVRFRNSLRRQGCLDRQANRDIARCAARSTCGKGDAVLCCTYDTSGTCDDPAPGDEIAAGVCSNDGGLTCNVDADCVTVGEPKVKRDAGLCTGRGGTVVGTGSVCAGCPALPPAP